MHRRLQNLALAAAGAAALAGVYAVAVEPRWLRLTRTRLHFRDLPPALEGVRIVLLTDLHLGLHTPANVLPGAVRMAARVRPDVVAITGDIGEDPDRLHAALRAFSYLTPPYGTYLVPGNHDHRDVGLSRWRVAVGEYPALTDLTNAARVVEVRRRGGAARLCISGVDDLAHGSPTLEMLPDRALRDFTVLLAHHPDQAELLRRCSDDVDLVLSGHTHGGQVRLPGVGALINSAAHPALYEAGVRRRPWTQVYTSTGLGTVHLPVRLFNRPEVALLILTSTPRPRR